MIKPIISVVGALFLSITMFEAQADLLTAATAQVGTTEFGIMGDKTDWTRITISGGPASGGGIPQTSFTTTGSNETITISFSAICNVNSSVYSVLFVQFRIISDGVSRTTSPKYSPLCVGHGYFNADRKEVNTVQSFFSVPTGGQHWYEVWVKLSNHNGPHTTTDGYASIGANTSVLRN